MLDHWVSERSDLHLIQVGYNFVLRLPFQYCLQFSRLFYVGAREGQMPMVLTMINRTTRTPIPAVMLTVSLNCLRLSAVLSIRFAPSGTALDCVSGALEERLLTDQLHPNHLLASHWCRHRRIVLLAKDYARRRKAY